MARHKWVTAAHDKESSSIWFNNHRMLLRRSGFIDEFWNEVWRYQLVHGLSLFDAGHAAINNVGRKRYRGVREALIKGEKDIDLEDFLAILRSWFEQEFPEEIPAVETEIEEEE